MRANVKVFKERSSRFMAMFYWNRSDFAHMFFVIFDEDFRINEKVFWNEELVWQSKSCFV